MDMNKNRIFVTRRNFLKLTSGIAAGSLLWGCEDKKSVSTVTQESGLTVFYNGTVLPVDDNFSEHQAFAIHENRIIA